MNVSVVITTKNESEAIEALLRAFSSQTQKPDEVIIADVDSTLEFEKRISPFKKHLSIQLIKLPPRTNRAAGRNQAIKMAKNEQILITDAGCIPKNNWVENMSKGFKKANVIAGFYKSDAKNIFEQCVASYTLVMPDQLNITSFLPATRSMGITKKVFEQMGGFNERYRYAEDYEFARRLQSHSIRMTVVKDAIVYWKPRQTLQSFARMIYEHAFGDGYSHTWRKKVWAIYLRYIVFIFLIVLALKFLLAQFFLLQLVSIYIVYSIVKNYRYARHPLAFIYLPTLQIVSDIVVMWGTINGIIASMWNKSLR